MKHSNISLSIYKSCTIVLCCLVLFVATSCSDWFDVSPKTDVKAKELFSTEAGFESSLTGIYLLMTDRDVYGGDMSYGLLDQLAQQYDYIPDGANDRNAIYNYETATTDGFRTKQRLADSWIKLYNIIANCNNFIKWLDLKGDEVVRNVNTRKLYRAEALAIRAYCHFDLLRAWGPWKYSLESSSTGKLTIPYRTVADNTKQPLLPAKDVIALILKDLLDAKNLLVSEQNESLKTSDRRYRFNYHAVNALLARVYSYAGDRENAIASAEEVIKKSGLELSSNNQDDPILFSECICALHKYHLTESLSQYWADGDKYTTQYFIRSERFNKYFEVSGNLKEDMRTKTAAFYEHSSTKTALSRKYSINSQEAIPLIRLPEMYYILAENTSDLTKAAKYLNAVRNKRGYSRAVNVKFTDAATQQEALDKEFRKEFYAEGQYWYFLKRHGITALSYDNTVTLTQERFEFPLPDAEKEYGWTASHDATR